MRAFSRLLANFSFATSGGRDHAVEVPTWQKGPSCGRPVAFVVLRRPDEGRREEKALQKQQMREDKHAESSDIHNVFFGFP